MVRSFYVTFTAPPTRTTFVGLGTALALGLTAMAAVTPGSGPVEATAAGAGVMASSAGAATAASPVAPETRSAPPASDRPGEPRATVQDGHFGGRELAVALAVAGRNVGDGLTEADVRGAAEALGVTLDDRVTVADTQELAAAGWAAAGHQFTLAGIHPGDAPDPSDIREAGARFGVEVPKAFQPAHVAAVLAAGRADVADAMAKAGFKFGDEVDVGELEKAAAALGVELGERLNAADAKTVVWKARDKVKRAWEAKHPSPAFARAAGVVLRLPSHRVEYAGFHQAAFPGVVTMKPAGPARTTVLPSRARATARSSAIDIVQAPREPVRAPVTGKVVEVTKYALYGKYTDVRMRIVPKENPDTVVSVLHVAGIKVKEGDTVEGGMTVIAAGPRKFPFRSQVDRFAGRDWGHVHIEIRNR